MKPAVGILFAVLVGGCGLLPLPFVNPGGLLHGMRPVPTNSPVAVVLPTGQPTPAPIIGVASWYDDGPGLYAAVHSWRWGDTPYSLLVCRWPGACVSVTVRDYCACYVGTKRERIVDLSPDAFKLLAPLGLGLVEVVVTP